jgi:hypothetical protein
VSENGDIVDQKEREKRRKKEYPNPVLTCVCVLCKEARMPGKPGLEEHLPKLGTIEKAKKAAVIQLKPKTNRKVSLHLIQG